MAPTAAPAATPAPVPAARAMCAICRAEMAGLVKGCQHIFSEGGTKTESTYLGTFLFGYDVNVTCTLFLVEDLSIESDDPFVDFGAHATKAWLLKTE